MPSGHVVVCKGYFICERPEAPELFTREGKPLPPKFGDWDVVFWGIPEENKRGRLPMALYVASEFNASLLIFTIGSAQLGSGQAEADWMRDYVFGCFHDLKRDYPQHFKGPRFGSEAKFLDWLKRIAVFEDEGHNTASSIQAAVALTAGVLGKRSGFVSFVTSQNHFSRTGRDEISAFAGAGELPGRVVVGGYAAETPYGGKSIDDVVVHDLGDPEHEAW